MRIPNAPIAVLLAAFAGLLTALPAPAQGVRGSGAAGGATQGNGGDVVEGTVTSVTPPAAGLASGPVVRLLGGAVAIDLAGADVLRYGPDGVPEAGPVAPGDRIVALVKESTSGGALVARSAFVHAERDGALLRGELESVDAPGKAFVLLGLTVRTTAATVFAGDGVQALADLRPGDPVVATVRSSGNALEAVRVLRTAPVPMPGERIRGRVIVIGTTSWTIAPTTTGPSVPEVVVEITADTRIVGDPKVGDEVEILARRDSAGRLVGVLVVRAQAPPVVPLRRLHGWVQGIAPDAWTIRTGPAGSLAPDLLVKVDASTKIVGSPKVGDEVEILLTTPATGPSTAVLILKLGPVPPLADPAARPQ